jgi:hypothetical protein
LNSKQTNVNHPEKSKKSKEYIMPIKNPIILFFLATGFLLWMGCETSTAPDENELVAILEQIVLQDSTILLDGLDDGSAMEEEYQFDLSFGKIVVQDTFPSNFRLVRFGRKFDGDPVRVVEIENDGRNADAFITTTRTGNFIVILRDTLTHMVIDSVSKPFTQVAWQQLKLHKFRDQDDESRNWRIVAFSPILSRTGTKALEITLLTLTGEDIDINLSNNTGDTMLDYYFDRFGLPIFHPAEQFEVNLMVSNADPFAYAPGEAAMIHYGLRRHILKNRRALRDPENDNIFSGQLYMHRSGYAMFMAFFDVIDLASIFDTAVPLNATFWAIPYRVQPDYYQ